MAGNDSGSSTESDWDTDSFAGPESVVVYSEDSGYETDYNNQFELDYYSTDEDTGTTSDEGDD